MTKKLEVDNRVSNAFTMRLATPQRPYRLDSPAATMSHSGQAQRIRPILCRRPIGEEAPTVRTQTHKSGPRRSGTTSPPLSDKTNRFRVLAAS